MQGLPITGSAVCTCKMFIKGLISERTESLHHIPSLSLFLRVPPVPALCDSFSLGQSATNIPALNLKIYVNLAAF